MRNLVLAFLLAVSSPALAGSLAGVDVPDQVAIGGQQLTLNGMGVRDKYFFHIYVGSLYLPAKTTSAAKAINDDVPKRLSMHFVYSQVTKDQLVATYEEGLAKNPDGAALKADFQKLYSWLDDVVSGESIHFDYVPGTGTKITVKGQVKGTIAGTAFMRALFTIYLGDNPPTSSFKKGILGG